MRRNKGSNQVDILNNTSFLDALFILVGALIFMLLLVALVSEGLKLGYFDLDMPYAEGASLPIGIVGQEYDMVVGVYGGNERYTCELVEGELPAGLRFIGEGSAAAPVEGVCRITGVPTEATDRPAELVLRADDKPVVVAETGEVLDKQAVTRTLNLSIMERAESTPLAVTMDAVPEAIRNSSYRLFLAAEGGAAPYRWSMTGELPTGLSLDPSGIISGRPTGIGSDEITLAVQDATGDRRETVRIALDVSQEFPDDLVITPLIIETEALPDATVGENYVLYLSASGGMAPYTWRSLGQLPDGVECCDDGVLRGSPRLDGEFPLRVEVSSSSNSVTDGEQVETTLTLRVNPVPPKRLPLTMFPARQQ